MPRVSFAHYLLTGCVMSSIAAILIIGLYTFEQRHPSKWLKRATIGLGCAIVFGVGVPWLLGQRAQNGVSLGLFGGIVGFVWAIFRVKA